MALCWLVCGVVRCPGVGHTGVGRGGPGGWVVVPSGLKSAASWSWLRVPPVLAGSLVGSTPSLLGSAGFARSACLAPLAPLAALAALAPLAQLRLLSLPSLLSLLHVAYSCFGSRWYDFPAEDR